MISGEKLVGFMKNLSLRVSDSPSIGKGLPKVELTNTDSKLSIYSVKLSFLRK